MYKFSILLLPKNCDRLFEMFKRFIVILKINIEKSIKI